MFVLEDYIEHVFAAEIQGRGEVTDELAHLLT